jgi:hypothetical protein
MEPCNQQSRPEEQRLYQHLLDLVQVETPSQMIARFRALLIDGVDYPEPEIINALDQITSSKIAEQEFKFILNRCCHILINRWHMQPQFYSAIPQLIATFESPPSRIGAHSFRQSAIRRLHKLVKLFVNSEQYITLRRLAQVMIQSNFEINSNTGNKPLLTLIRRYPYLYEHCLISEEPNYEQQQTIQYLKDEVQKKFEIDLSQYVTYQVRRSQILTTAPNTEVGRILRPVCNPTLLSDRELNAALMHFMGKVDSVGSYNDLAQKFLNHTRHTPTFKAFKDDLYEYLISSLDSGYGKLQFNERLYTQLCNTAPDCDQQKLNEFLLVRTCTQLLNFLVVESPANPQHFTFVDLITNQGTTLTTGLLLKIVLICRKVKPYLEKRFAILFSHYESAATNCIQWLVKSLEKLNVALSIHFGKVDLSLLNQVNQ